MLRSCLLIVLLLHASLARSADVQESAFFKKSQAVEPAVDMKFCGFLLGGSMDQAVKDVPKSMRFVSHSKDAGNETVVFQGGPLKGTDTTALIFVNGKLAMVQVHLPDQKYALIKLAEKKFTKRIDDGKCWVGEKNGIMVQVTDKNIVASHIELLGKLTENTADDLGSL